MPTEQEIREYFANFGRLGGKATAEKRTPAQRKRAAKKAADARWARLKELADDIDAKTKALDKKAKKKK